MTTRYLTATPAARWCLCAAEPLLQEVCPSHAGTSLSLRLTYLLLAPSLVISALSAPSGLAGAVRGQAWSRPVRPRASGMATLLTEMKNAPKFFPSASEESEESSLISPPSLGVPFRMRSAQSARGADNGSQKKLLRGSL